MSLGTYNGAYYVFGSYLYDGSYTTGHVELSDDGVTSCGYPGTLLSDSLWKCSTWIDLLD